MRRCKLSTEPSARAILLLRIVFVIGLAAGGVKLEAQSPQPNPLKSYTRYLDPVAGMSVDNAVDLALKNNLELAAMRKEFEAGEALLRQAGLRSNPSIELRGTRQISGGDNSFMIEGGLPLELGGRRNARIRVASQELEIRRQAVAERERKLAAEVRNKFGERSSGRGPKAQVHRRNDRCRGRQLRACICPG